MKKSIVMLAAIITITIAATAQDTQLQPAIARLDKAASVKDYQQLAGVFEQLAEQQNQWLPYYYAAFCNAKVAWLKTDDPDNIEPFANKADELSKKAISLIDSSSQQKEISEIYCVLSMARRAVVYINPMTYGREYGIASTNFMMAARQANPDNPRALYLAGWEKYATPKLYGGDKVKAKELLTGALQKLSNDSAGNIEPHWGRAEVEEILGKIK